MKKLRERVTRSLLIISLLGAALVIPTTAHGIVNPDRAVGVDEATWTAMLTIRMDGEAPITYCTGALVATNLVLTAAHCVIDAPMDALEVRIGNRTFAGDDGVLRFPVAVVYHGKYERTAWTHTFDDNGDIIDSISGDVRAGESEYDSDIALILLNKKVSNIQPVRLPSSNIYKPVKGWRTYGWGTTGDNEDSDPQELLTAAQQDLTSLAKKSYEGTFKYLIGAGMLKGELSSGTCWGDSGGPLVDGANVLIGLTSMADTDRCADPVPTLFTKVSAFISWKQLAQSVARKSVQRLAAKSGTADTAIPVIALE